MWEHLEAGVTMLLFIEKESGRDTNLYLCNQPSDVMKSSFWQLLVLLSREVGLSLFLAPVWLMMTHRSNAGHVQSCSIKKKKKKSYPWPPVFSLIN